MDALGLRMDCYEDPRLAVPKWHAVMSAGETPTRWTGCSGQANVPRQPAGRHKVPMAITMVGPRNRENMRACRFRAGNDGNANDL